MSFLASSRHSYIICILRDFKYRLSWSEIIEEAK